jgi:hypothetical protein
VARSVTAYVSAHQRTRCHASNFVRGDVFTLGANFTACLNGAAVDSVTWQSSNAQAASFGAGGITGGLATITCTAGEGHARLKATATLSDDRVVTQLYEVTVLGDPWFDGEHKLVLEWRKS